MPRPKLATKRSTEAPARAVERLQLAIALHQREDLEGAEAGYRAALALDPLQVFALQLLGVLLNQTGRSLEGLERIDEALALAPQLPDIHVARGDTLIRLRRFEGALSAYDEAIRLRPHHFASWKGRGGALRGLNRVGEALEAFDRALAIKPDHADTLTLRSEALAEGRFFYEAFAAVDRALAVSPGWAPAWVQRGTLLHNLGQMQEALACFEIAVAKSPEEVPARIGRGVALGRLRRFDDAIASLDETLMRSPDNFEARFQRSNVNFMRGELAAGWRDYEARFAARPETARFVLGPQPIWRGESIGGKKILVHDEQGYGDVLQFCRYLCELEALDADVTFSVRANLAPLLQSLPGGVKVTTAVESFDGFDYQCPLMSLPLAFRTELATIPASVPYLSVDPERVAWWRERLGGGFKVGVVWSASIFGFRQGRSVELAEFAGLSRIPGVRLLSLQKEVGVELLSAPPQGMKIETLGAEYENGDFLETAAVVMALDLVVSVDTAIAHLAGALGRPVWVALPYISDWRWLLDRSDSPWYPTMRLFRSRAWGGWSGVFSDVEKELRALTQT